MRMAIFSELHAHPFREFSDYIDGVNGRLLEIINRLGWIVQWANLPRFDLLLHTGDFFHERRKIDTVTMELSKKALAGLRKPMLSCSGTHDITYSGHSSLMVFKDLFSEAEMLMGNRRVYVDERVTFPDYAAGVEWVFELLPHAADYERTMALAVAEAEKLRSVPHRRLILVVHEMFKGARIGPITFDGLDLEKLHSVYDFVILGHIHNPQTHFPYNNVLIPGHCIPHGFGDEGGGTVWDIDLIPRSGGGVEVRSVRHDFTHPQFVTSDVRRPAGGTLAVVTLDPSDYHRIRLSQECQLEVSPPDAKYCVVHEGNVEGETQHRMELPASQHPTAVVDAFVEAMGPGDAPWEARLMKFLGRALVSDLEVEAVCDIVEELLSETEASVYLEWKAIVHAPYMPIYNQAIVREKRLLGWACSALPVWKGKD